MKIIETTENWVFTKKTNNLADVGHTLNFVFAIFLK